MSVALVPTGNIFTPDGFATTQKIAETLVKSGILPRGIDTPAKAFAVIVKGWEIGVGPMRALTGIHLIEGKPSVSPELKLERFRERGGRIKWVRSDGLVAECTLTAPNGDTHTECVTLEEMKTAGVATKDNWRKYPKSMLRARCVAFGLRALGEGDGSYTPDELGTVTSEEGTPQEPAYTPPPARDEAKREILGNAPPAKEAPQDAGKATSTRPAGAPTASARHTEETVPFSAPPKTYAPANTIKVAKGDKMVSVELGKEVIALAAETLDDSTFRETWLKPYKTHEGVQVGSVSQLTEAQAENIRRRLVAQRDRNKVRHERGEAEMAGNLASMLETPRAPTAERAPTPRNLDDEFQRAFENDESEREWVHGLFGVESVKDLDRGQQETALSLILAWNTPLWDETEQKARALGRIR